MKPLNLYPMNWKRSGLPACKTPYNDKKKKSLRTERHNPSSQRPSYAASILSFLFNIFVLSSPSLCAEPIAPPSSLLQTSPTEASPAHGIAIFGDLKYPPSFTHFDYANPNALKGGQVKLGWFGSYDNFNPFIIKGNAAIGSSLLHCTLLGAAEDEAASLYAYLAEKVEVAPDRKSETFTLNENAKFSDGTPVTADDVIFSFHTLLEKGLPTFKQYYKDVKSVEKMGPHQVRFVFSTDKNRELPMILGQLPVFSKAYYEKHDFEKASLTPPVGCGPYKIANFKAGQSVHYERIPGWWGENLPSQKGQHNFDITYIYYRDQGVQFEAFKGGEYDFRTENIAKNWATGYKIPAVKDGRIILKEVLNHIPAGLQLIIFNTRKPLFKDPKVREALTNALDFEWANKNLFFNAYTRASSYFNNSEFVSSGLPQGEELKILESFKKDLPPEIFTEEFKLPVTNGSGNDRKVLAAADKLLKEAGWSVKNGKRINNKTGEPFIFELLLSDPSFERVALALQRNLSPLGIDMKIRTITPSQYLERIGDYDFDMIVQAYPQSETPGNELRSFWGSKEADTKNGYNFAGIKNPVIDELIELIINSPDRITFTNLIRALDRVMLKGYYGIPTWYTNKSRIAYKNKFGIPEKKPKDGVGFSTWWVDPTLENKLKK